MSSDVTIILPVYCDTQLKLQWLEECLQSIVSQGCSIVAFDDGSPENVLPILSKYIIDIAYSRTNRGVSFARNECVKLVKTDLILPLDCDDKLRPGAISQLESVWNGIPIYPDISKFGMINDPHYNLMNFSCDHITNYVGFTTVNVLHSVEQHKSVGGWDENLDFYEDGEYNARLFAMFCGQRYPKPLVDYRIHPTQRTKKYQKLAAEYAARILSKVRSIKMACSGCGKRRSNVNNVTGRPVLSSSVARGPATEVMIGESYKNVPLEFGGRVLAVYIGGKGKAKHYYKGEGSKQSYRVLHGDHIYANPADVREPENTADTRQLVRVKREEPQPVVKVAKPPKPQPVEVKPQVPVEVTPSPQESVKEPSDTYTPPQPVYDLPNLRIMSTKEIEGMDLGGLDIPALIRMEARGRNRKGVIAYLKRHNR